MRTDDQWIAEAVTGRKNITLTSQNQKRKDVVVQFANYYLPQQDKKAVPDNLSGFESELRGLVGDAPIKDMVRQIATYDRQTAGLVVGIAKKESDWGKHAPSKNGETCYNYWGYKGTGTRGTSMGYACFGSTGEAVEIVASRIEHFVSRNLNTPSKMIVWKCGSSCTGHDPAGVRKWISDVSGYYNQIAYNK